MESGVVTNLGFQVSVRALGPIAPGDELLIRYADVATNESLFVKFGFVLDQNGNDVQCLRRRFGPP